MFVLLIFINSLDFISIHEAFADLDVRSKQDPDQSNYFNPRGLRRPRPDITDYVDFGREISIHEAFADLDLFASVRKITFSLFQSTRPSQTSTVFLIFYNLSYMYFNPRGLRRPRQLVTHIFKDFVRFQSTRPSQTSTFCFCIPYHCRSISIHEAFADLDMSSAFSGTNTYDFNPRGLRRPRQQKCSIKCISFQHIYTNIILFHYIPPSPLLNNLPFYRHSSIILVRICWGIYVHLGFAPERIDRLIPIVALKEYPLNPVRL